MPIYEYSCPDCGCRFEELIRSSGCENIHCPDCGSAKAEKMMSVCGFVSKSGGVTTASSHSGSCGNCGSHHCTTCHCGH